MENVDKTCFSCGVNYPAYMFDDTNTDADYSHLYKPSPLCRTCQQKYITCTACGNDFPATSRFFYAKKRGKYGLGSRCKSCVNRINLERHHGEKHEQNLLRMKGYIQRRKGSQSNT